MKGPFRSDRFFSAARKTVASWKPSSKNGRSGYSCSQILDSLFECNNKLKDNEEEKAIVADELQNAVASLINGTKAFDGKNNIADVQTCLSSLVLDGSVLYQQEDSAYITQVDDFFCYLMLVSGEGAVTQLLKKFPKYGELHKQSRFGACVKSLEPEKIKGILVERILSRVNELQVYGDIFNIYMKQKDLKGAIRKSVESSEGYNVSSLVGALRRNYEKAASPPVPKESFDTYFTAVREVVGQLYQDLANDLKDDCKSPTILRALLNISSGEAVDAIEACINNLQKAQKISFNINPDVSSAIRLALGKTRLDSEALLRKQLAQKVFKKIMESEEDFCKEENITKRKLGKFVKLLEECGVTINGDVKLRDIGKENLSNLSVSLNECRRLDKSISLSDKT